MLKLGSFTDSSMHKWSWEVVKNAWALLEDLPKKAYGGQYISKKRSTLFTLKLAKKKKKFSWRFSVSRTRKWAYSPQHRIFDDIPILSVLRGKKREVMFFFPTFWKLIFLIAFFINFIKLYFSEKTSTVADSYLWTVEFMHLSDDKTPPPLRTHWSQPLAHCQTFVTFYCPHFGDGNPLNLSQHVPR